MEKLNLENSYKNNHILKYLKPATNDINCKIESHKYFKVKKS